VEIYVDDWPYLNSWIVQEYHDVMLVLPATLPPQPPGERPLWAELASRAERRMELLGYRNTAGKGNWDEGVAMFERTHAPATYKDLLSELATGEEVRHIRALIDARGAELSDPIAPDFFDVLSEEGYPV